MSFCRPTKRLTPKIRMFCCVILNKSFFVLFLFLTIRVFDYILKLKGLLLEHFPSRAICSSKCWEELMGASGFGQAALVNTSQRGSKIPKAVIHYKCTFKFAERENHPFAWLDLQLVVDNMALAPGEYGATTRSRMSLLAKLWFMCRATAFPHADELYRVTWRFSSVHMGMISFTAMVVTGELGYSGLTSATNIIIMVRTRIRF